MLRQWEERSRALFIFIFMGRKMIDFIKKFKKWLIGIFIGGVALAAGTSFIPTRADILGAIPASFFMGEQNVSIAYTDKTDGEDLIIKSDKQIYDSDIIYFSVSNVSAKDQNVQIAFFAKWDLKSVRRFVRNDTQMTSSRLIPAKGTTTQEIIPSGIKTIPVWEDIQILNKSFSYFIRSGETIFFQAESDYSKAIASLPMKERLTARQIDLGEWFIKATGSESVGELDPSTLLNNLVSYWKCDETSGTALADSVTTNNLTTNGTVNQTGIIGKAVHYTRNSSQYSYKTDTASLSITGNISISAWIKLDSKPSDSSGKFVIAAKYDVDASPSFGYAFRIEDANHLQLIYADSSGNSTNKYTDYAFSNLGTWYHVITTAIVSSKDIALYVNNEIEDGTYPGQNASSIGDNAVAFEVGATVNGAGQYGLFDGLIDEVAIWNRVLTSDEVAALYNNGAGFQYPFEAGGGGGWEFYEVD
jgi:hypothetical protein